MPAAPACPEILDSILRIPNSNDTVLYYALVPSNNPPDDDNGLFCAHLEVDGESWVGFGVSEEGQMTGSIAIIGLPDEDTVLKYDLGGKGDGQQVVMDDDRQTLMDASIVQEDGVTTMTFAKLLVEEGEIPILEEGPNNFLFALGSSNELGYHSSRVQFTLDFSEEHNNAWISISPSKVPSSASPTDCFRDSTELNAAVDLYIKSGCSDDSSCADGFFLEKYGWPIGTWCVSKVKDMSNLFWFRSDFNEDLSGWDVSSVNNMASIFQYAAAFNGNISSWDISSVTNMASAFEGAASFNSDLSKWDTSSVTEMQNAFFEASSFNSDISGWSTSSVEYMSYMFYEATAFGRDLSAWDIGNVQFMYGMFQNAASLDEDLCAWADAFFPYDNAGDIFAGSGCFFQDDPQLDERGPFCASSCK